jgi:hypothetical protein
MRDAAGAFNDKTTSWRAGGFAVRSHVIRSSLYRHAGFIAGAHRGTCYNAAQMTLCQIGFRRLISERANH